MKASPQTPRIDRNQALSESKREDFSGVEKQQAPGTQTLLRGLALLECVAEGIGDAKGIATRMRTPRSTTHRMLNSLVLEGYLHHVPYHGYLLGPKLIHLGMIALEQRPLAAQAHPHLEKLSDLTGDTVHLGIEEETQVLYLDKISGTRGLEMRSRIGASKPIASTGLGKALMLGISPTRWHFLYDAAVADQRRSGMVPMLAPWPEYKETLLKYAKQGWVYDLEEHEPGIRCIAAPVYDVLGKVVAAVSVASAVPYMPETRMAQLAPVILETVRAISRDLGWRG